MIKEFIFDVVAPFGDFGALRSFICGAMMMTCLAIGMFFFRFWKQTGDRLFMIFGVAFLFLGVERLILALQDTKDETSPSVFLIRLVAFIVIIGAIVDKNRSIKS